MLKYKIILKGLQPKQDDYIVEELFICAETEIQIEALIADAIYELRNQKKYYKMKYVSKELCNDDEKCVCGVEQVQSELENPSGR
ncbi:hypothetical protein pEaSNUABM19_00561 [Erwinia phage pEa_SNUABM_19]|nr:hypothetical protein pEaSNUABM19_00561 [Erwinia phage pEa_SNUABM_19]QXO12221.1 hypothetical protein pEaSNUABM44_00560 [Erwinia phage pEa_SNUABM_44]QXO12775.1 hypothetical protein pEaSNUABM49_00562 [Erwinia phage pEa_SNUABM_49]